MISLKDKTILVVDDELGYREVYGAEFQALDATVLTAENGARALEIAQSQRIDAIVSDVRMPIASGVDLLERLKGINPSAPVVVLITGYSDLSSEDAYDKGAEALLSKPCDLDLLVESVYRALLPEKERWVKSFETLPSDLKLELEAESLGGAVRARILSLGRGGMFIALDGAQPQVGTKVVFRVLTNSAAHPEFKGAGICRWSRSRSDSGLSDGMGIEFQNLSEESLEALFEVLETLKPKAFIPKQNKGN